MIPVLNALLFGLVPAFIWLVFWLSEDRKHPEPKRLIALSFLGGIAALLVALSFEFLLSDANTAEFTTKEIVSFAVVEEVAKYAAALLIALKSREFNEGIDALIYMISVALGFAAFENFLYVLGPLADSQFVEAMATSNLRFLGATLLHVVASASIGVALALSYYARIDIRIIATILGIISAVGLHALFNFLIMNLPVEALFTVFLLIWILAVVLLLITERVKKIDRAHDTTLPPLTLR